MLNFNYKNISGTDGNPKNGATLLYPRATVCAFSSSFFRRFFSFKKSSIFIYPQILWTLMVCVICGYLFSTVLRKLLHKCLYCFYHEEHEVHEEKLHELHVLHGE